MGKNEYERLKGALSLSEVEKLKNFQLQKSLSLGHSDCTIVILE